MCISLDDESQRNKQLHQEWRCDPPGMPILTGNGDVTQNYHTPAQNYQNSDSTPPKILCSSKFSIVHLQNSHINSRTLSRSPGKTLTHPKTLREVAQGYVTDYTGNFLRSYYEEINCFTHEIDLLISYSY